MKDPIEKLNKWIKGNNTCIVNCIGAIPQKPFGASEMLFLNSTFPHMLSNFCKEKDIRLIHISTNCVFSGNKSLCNELDIPDATDTYGLSKYKGEPSYGLVIRTSIIGFEKNTKYGLMEWYLQNKDKEVFGYQDNYWNGVTTYELSNILYDIIEKRNIPNTGLWHIYSEQTVSKFDILSYLRAKFECGPIIQPISNGVKYYTLASNNIQSRKSIFLQIDDMYSLYNAFKEIDN
jgi:dTDP-4-dehydrorhamnose reductase